MHYGDNMLSPKKRGPGSDQAEIGGMRGKRPQQQNQQVQQQQQHETAQRSDSRSRSRRQASDEEIEVLDVEDEATKAKLTKLISKIILELNGSKAAGKRGEDVRFESCRLASGEIDAVLSATFCSSPNNSLEGYKQIYKGNKLLVANVIQAIEAGDMKRANHYLKTLKALSGICLEAAENLGPRPGCGLNAMLKYVNRCIMDCLLEPEAVTDNATAANTVLEAVRAESGCGSGGIRRGRAERDRKRDRDDSRERDYRRNDYKRAGSARYDDRQRGDRR